MLTNKQQAQINKFLKHKKTDHRYDVVKFSNNDDTTNDVVFNITSYKQLDTAIDQAKRIKNTKPELVVTVVMGHKDQYTPLIKYDNTVNKTRFSLYTNQNRIKHNYYFNKVDR